MKTVTLEVDDLLSILDFAAVEKRLTGFAGVHKVAINAGSNSASVTFDDRVTGREGLVEQIRACGFHCRGEVVPRHSCVPGEMVADGDGRPRRTWGPVAWRARPRHASSDKTGRSHARRHGARYGSWWRHEHG